MNKFSLNFQRKDLESQYQLDQLASIKKPIFIFMIFACLLINTGVFAIHIVINGKNEWYYQNIVFAFLCIIQIIVIVIMKKLQYLQLALTITNIILGFLELNVDPSSTTSTEYFAYGNVFTQLQVVLYLISDFSHVIIQIVCHYIARSAITIYLSKHIDYTLMSVGFISLSLILITIYVNDRNKRRHFLQNLKDNYLDQITSFLIQEPFLKISLNTESVVLLKKRQLKLINFKKVLFKISHIYSNLICKRQLVQIQTEGNDKHLFTFVYQLKIFFIQLFDIIVRIQRKKELQISIFLFPDQNHLHMIIALDNSQQLLKKFESNYFIKEVIPLLTEDYRQKDNNIIFSFKNYSKDSFYHLNS